MTRLAEAARTAYRFDMDVHDRRTLGYAELAALAARRGQRDGRVGFLALAGINACRAGLPEIAASCLAEILEANERHLLTNYATFGDALRDPDFEPFVRSLERKYGWERSEHVLAELGVSLEIDDADAFVAHVSGLVRSRTD